MANYNTNHLQREIDSLRRQLSEPGTLGVIAGLHAAEQIDDLARALRALLLLAAGAAYAAEPD